MRSQSADRLMDVNGLAQRLGVNVRYVRRLIAERRVPFIKVGHLVRFEPSEIEAWLDRSRVDGAPAGSSAGGSWLTAGQK